MISLLVSGRSSAEVLPKNTTWKKKGFNFENIYDKIWIRYGKVLERGNCRFGLLYIKLWLGKCIDLI